MEVTNRALENIIPKVVIKNIKHWLNKLIESTWVYNIIWKTTTRFALEFELVYGKEALLSIEFEYNILRIVA